MNETRCLIPKEAWTFPSMVQRGLDGSVAIDLPDCASPWPSARLRTDSLPAGEPWLYELKLDGYRAIAFRRNGYGRANDLTMSCESEPPFTSDGANRGGPRPQLDTQRGIVSRGLYGSSLDGLALVVLTKRRIVPFDLSPIGFGAHQVASGIAEPNDSRSWFPLGSRVVPKHTHLFDRHEGTPCNHLVEDRQESIDMCLVLDNLDDDRQICRQLDQPGGVDDAVRAKARRPRERPWHLRNLRP